MIDEITNTTLLLSALGILALLVLVLAIWLLRVQRRLNIALRSKNGTNIDETLKEMQDTIARLYSFSQKADVHLGDLEHRMQSTLRGVETLRFNPFSGDGSGGNNSFSTALISERGDGIVISSLYTRDRTNVFAKRLEKLAPSHELSEEEEQAVTRAHKRIARTNH